MKKGNNLFKKIAKNWQIKLISIIFAIVIYLLISLSMFTTRTISIKLDVIENPNYKIENVLKEKVDIQIRGSESVIYLVNPNNIKAILDVSSTNKIGITKLPVTLIYNGPKLIKEKVTLNIEPTTMKVLLSKVDNND